MTRSLDLETEDAVQIHGENSTHAAPGSHININRIDVSDRTLSVLAIVIAVLSMATSVMLINSISDRFEDMKARLASQNRELQLTERESRLAQQDAMLLRASLIAHGITINEDRLHAKESQ